jgi:hypothetical protein
LRPASSWSKSNPAAPAAPGDAPRSGVAIIEQYYRDRYRPVFKDGNAIHTEDGDDVKMAVAISVTNDQLIEALSKATDAPRTQEGVKWGSLPRFFSTWAKTAWGNLLDSLPDEDNAELGADSPPGDKFRQMVRDALLRPWNCGTVVRGRAQDHHNEPVQVERRPVISWCRRFAELGEWDDLRGLKIWFKEQDRGDGHVKLMVALRHEVFGQIGGVDRRLTGMPPKKFARRAAKHGVGQSGGEDHRPQGNRAIVLSGEFLDDLLGGMPDEPMAPQEDHGDERQVPPAEGADS